jgi:glycogen synthase
MAAGCVPIVSRIRAVTDTIVRDSESGLLFPLGDVHAAAAAVRRLALDRVALRRMSETARTDVQHRFAVEAMAYRYAAILSAIRAAPRPIASPLPITRWSYPSGLNPGLRTYLPTGIKNTLRVWRERLA